MFWWLSEEGRHPSSTKRAFVPSFRLFFFFSHRRTRRSPVDTVFFPSLTRTVQIVLFTQPPFCAVYANASCALSAPKSFPSHGRIPFLEDAMIFPLWFCSLPHRLALTASAIAPERTTFPFSPFRLFAAHGLLFFPDSRLDSTDPPFRVPW